MRRYCSQQTLKSGELWTCQTTAEHDRSALSRRKHMSFCTCLTAYHCSVPVLAAPSHQPFPLAIHSIRYIDITVLCAARNTRGMFSMRSMKKERNAVFWPRDAMLAPYICYGHVSVCPSVCPGQAGIVPKQLSGSSWFCFCTWSWSRPTMCMVRFKMHTSTRYQTKHNSHFAKTNTKRVQLNTFYGIFFRSRQDYTPLPWAA